MNFKFNENYQGFQANQMVKLNLINYQKNSAILCEVKESCDAPGIYRKINLPECSEYTLKLDLLSNNDRTYLRLLDAHGESLIGERSYLPKNKRKTINLKFYAMTTQIKLGIFMGGDSIALAGNRFMLFSIKINLQQSPDREQNSQQFKITRIFSTVKELHDETFNPLRTNETPMQIGEYAILKESESSEELYILSLHGLQHACRIRPAQPAFFGQVLNQLPGHVMPIYSSHQTAQNQLNQSPDTFYQPQIKMNQTNEWHDQLQGDIYLYLDQSGFVRWLKHQPDLNSSET